MKKILAILLSFGIISFNVYATDMLIPMGNTTGIKILCDGVMVSNMTQINTENGPRYPISDANIVKGDIIKSINGKKVSTNEELSNQINLIGNNTVPIKIERNGKIIESTITPVQDINDGAYKIGLWVRDSLAGIGTITYLDPETNNFGALGHSISEMDSGKLMPIKQGELVESQVIGVKKGVAGSAGELKGQFNLQNEIGTIMLNSANGIYGNSNELKSIHKPIQTANFDEIKLGKATIYSNINAQEVKEYTIEIIKINNQGTKNFEIKVTDPELLEKTGGIVQGMSGSPIIQNGKLIGAVTHVFVNDPTMGFGIFIDNMLETAESVE